MLAIIGGSGLGKLATIEAPHRRVVRTPYGEPSGAMTFGRLCGRDVVFLPRHGHGHTIAPHEVNYRANIWALREEKVTAIISVASVGGIRADLAPGVLAVPHQIIDYTHGRRGTFSSTTLVAFAPCIAPPLPPAGPASPAVPTPSASLRVPPLLAPRA